MISEKDLPKVDRVPDQERPGQTKPVNDKPASGGGAQAGDPSGQGNPKPQGQDKI